MGTKYTPLYGEVYASFIDSLANPALFCNSASQEWPHVVGLFKPGVEAYKYENSWAQVVVGAWAGVVKGIRVWMQHAADLNAPGPAVTIRAAGIRWQLWQPVGKQLSIIKSSAPLTISVDDVIRVEKKGPEVRVQINGSLLDTCILPEFDTGPGWMGVGFSHDCQGCALKRWQQGQLGEFTR